MASEVEFLRTKVTELLALLEKRDALIAKILNDLDAACKAFDKIPDDLL